MKKLQIQEWVHEKEDIPCLLKRKVIDYFLLPGCCVNLFVTLVHHFICEVSSLIFTGNIAQGLSCPGNSKYNFKRKRNQSKWRCKLADSASTILKTRKLLPRTTKACSQGLKYWNQYLDRRSFMVSKSAISGVLYSAC